LSHAPLLAVPAAAVIGGFIRFTLERCRVAPLYDAPAPVRALDAGR
jgi:branched-subunit amino acid ABC-type transport system permease component